MNPRRARVAAAKRPAWIRLPAFVVIALAFAMVAGGARDTRAGEFERATRAAETGSASGFYRLGRLYETGREVERDLFEALRLYEEAAERGHVEAQFSAALLMLGAVPESPRSPQRAFQWLTRAADNGHSMAAYFIAMSYEAGEGVAANSEKAFEWYRRAAQDGNGGAMNGLARMYASGAGVRMDLARAFAWNQASGTRGHEGWQVLDSELAAKMNDQEHRNGERFAKSLIAKYGDPTIAPPDPNPEPGQLRESGP
jgi:TPR repeat protein